MAASSTIGTPEQDENSNRAPRFGQSRPITRLSTGADGREAKGGSFDPVLSADGTTLVFASEAGNLVPGDTNGVRDVFLKDLKTGAVTRVSTAADGTQANGASDGLYRSVSLSADGTKIAFASEASNLVPGDTNRTGDIFVKDLVNNAITRVDTAADGTQTPRGSSSTEPVISSDGTKVAFVSSAGTLVPGDSNGARDIFVKDLATGAVTRIDTAADGAQAEAGSDSFGAVFSPDGTKIAFASNASNLVAGDTNGTPDIFIEDLKTSTIARYSTDSNGDQIGASSVAPIFSPDGTKIAFVDYPNYQLYIKDLSTGSLDAVVHLSETQIEGFTPDSNELVFVSGDGTLVPDDTNGSLDVFKVRLGQTTTGFVRDRADQLTASTSGALPFTDADVGDIHAVTVKPGDGAVGTLTATIGKEPDSDGPGSIGWTYTVDHKAVADLAKGQSKVETFTVTVDDGHGGIADQAVTITVRGSETPQAADQIHTDPGGTTSPAPLAHPAADSVPVADTHHGHGLTGFEF